MSEAPPLLPASPLPAPTPGPAGFACPNCGTHSEGGFCPACGQKRIHPGDLSLRHAWHHVVHELAHVDGKILHSLRLLFTQPGRLTLDFFEGRRARHVHPIRLFLTFGVVFFFFAHVNSPLDIRALVEMQPPAAQQQWAHLVGKRGLTLDQFLDRTNGRMDAIFKTVETTAILLNGFWLWVLFRQRRPYLAEHLVTTLHLACFTMALWLPLSLLHLAGVSRMLTAPVILAALFVYFLLTARRVYGGNWLGLAGRWAILQILRMAVILLALIAVVASVLRQAAPPH